MIAWGAKVSPDFRNKVISICHDLGIPPDWLMACMHFESGGTFSPKTRNKVSGATGPIQIMPKTAKELGTTCDLLAAMSDIDYLAYVWKYFAPWAGKLHTLEDTYMRILWPRAIGHDDDYVLFDKAIMPTTYGQNKGLDDDRDGVVEPTDGDGKISKWEASARVRQSLAQGLRAENIG